jgi:hypothetical protein
MMFTLRYASINEFKKNTKHRPYLPHTSPQEAKRQLTSSYVLSNLLVLFHTLLRFEKRAFVIVDVVMYGLNGRYLVTLNDDKIRYFTHKNYVALWRGMRHPSRQSSEV